MNVSALTFTREPRHGNIRLRMTISKRAESLARRGLTLRSWKSASCLRRKRFSAARARREWAVRTARRSRSATTGTIVRKQCATVRKSDEPGINAQDGTLQNVTGFPCGLGQSFCGLQQEAHHEGAGAYTMSPPATGSPGRIARRAQRCVRLSHARGTPGTRYPAAPPLCADSLTGSAAQGKSRALRQPSAGRPWPRPPPRQKECRSSDCHSSCG
jgi:hypothetical protein